MKNYFNTAAAILLGLVATDAILAHRELNRQERSVAEDKLQDTSSKKFETAILQKPSMFSFLGFGPYQRLVTGNRFDGNCLRYFVHDTNLVTRILAETGDCRGYALHFGMIGQKTVCKSEARLGL